MKKRVETLAVDPLKQETFEMMNSNTIEAKTIMHKDAGSAAFKSKTKRDPDIAALPGPGDYNPELPQGKMQIESQASFGSTSFLKQRPMS